MCKPSTATGAAEVDVGPMKHENAVDVEDIAGTMREPQYLLQGEVGFGSREHASIFLIDCMFWACIFARDYSDGMNSWNGTVAHYFSAIFVTDVFIFFLPPNRQCWWNFFRVISSVQMLNATAMLLIFDQDGPWLWISVARLALGTVRLVHAVALVLEFGPSGRMIVSLPAYIHDRCTNWNAEQKREPTKTLLLILFGPMHKLALFFLAYVGCQFFWLCHYNFGNDKIDTILTAFQAFNGTTVFLKGLVLSMLLTRQHHVIWAEFLVAFGLCAQWPMMWDNFYKAPVPVFHILIEALQVGALVSALLSPAAPHEECCPRERRREAVPL